MRRERTAAVSHRGVRVHVVSAQCGGTVSGRETAKNLAKI
jgi:hypothetical protein